MRLKWTSAFLFLLLASELVAQDYNVPFRRRGSDFVDPTCSREFGALDYRIVIADGGVDSAIDFSGTNGFTFCAWLEPDGIGVSGGRIFDKHGSQAQDTGFSWAFVDSANEDFVMFVNNDLTDNYGVSATGIWTVSTWECHCVTVRHGSFDDVTFYVNGSAFGSEQDGSIASGPVADNSTDFYIGIRQDLYREMDARIAYIQAWSEPITNETTLTNACYDPCSEPTNQVFGLTLCDDSSTQTDYIGSWDGTVTGPTLVTDNGPPITGMSCVE